MSELYGLMAIFDSPEAVLAAVQRARAAGYSRLEAYTPFPVEGLADAVGFGVNWVPLITLLGGLAGGLTGFFMQYYAAVYSYPIDVGGRPLNSWPSFVPITFELTVLFAAFAALFGMAWLNGLPQPYHAVFNAAHFELATRNRFFLCIEATDPLFDVAGTQSFLQDLTPLAVEAFDA